MQRFFCGLIILLTVLGIDCNRRNADFDTNLQMADRFMNTHPDSALHILTDIDTTGLDRSRMAHYALLLTKAQNKNYIIPKNDSLILKAVDYYRGRDNNEEIQALYYYGDLSYSKDSIENALIYLHLANDLAKEHKDYFYEGLSARALSSLYGQQYIYDKYLSLGKEAQESFAKYEKELNNGTCKYSKWMDIMIADAYNSLKQPLKALEISNNPDSMTYNTDSYFRYRTIQNKANSYHLLGRFKDAVGQYELMTDHGFKMSGEDWCMYSHNLFNSGHRALAESMLDSARVYASTPQEKSYLKMLEGYMLASHGDFEKAYESARSWEVGLAHRTDSLLENPQTLMLAEAYKTKIEIQKQNVKLERSKNLLLLCILVIIMLLLLILFSRYRTKLKSNRLETALLESRLSELGSENKQLSENLEKMGYSIQNIKDISSKEKDSLKKHIANRLKTIDEVCRLWYRMPDNKNIESSLPPAARMQLEDLRTESSLEYLDCLIDIYSDSIVDEIRKISPSIRSSLLRQARYMYVGFSNETIIYLLAKKNSYALATDKNRLKNEILKGEKTMAEELLKRLNITPVKKDK